MRYRRSRAPAPAESRGHDRRSALSLLCCCAAGLTQSATAPNATLRQLQAPAVARTAVYLGSGCFWHTQYDFYVAERTPRGSFQRTDEEVTSRVGYAGGFGSGAGGRVCYHSSQNLPGTDYHSPLGHAEATEVLLDDGPQRTAQFQEILIAFWEEFDVRSDGSIWRLDPQDEGSAYRPVIGLPGGVASDLYPVLVQSNAEHKQIPLQPGHDLSARGTASADTSEYGVSEVIYVYDTGLFPFYRAEQFHQYHPNLVIQRTVPQRYLETARDRAASLGHIDATGCPDTLVDVARSQDAPPACYSGAPACVGRSDGYLLPVPSCMCSPDCVPGVDDLLALLGVFGSVAGIPLMKGDIDDNGAVDIADLLLLLGAFGTAC
jgi:peptide methionine sulfoxide reductase MsrA